ncbi:MAG: alanine racemase [Candidatus Marinimicrobia bacterium]|nr:alanine racemase [Candidatus Neomarinimicrobiota bacterium]MBL7022614.1 alanine racemase [Candidatus Neomarinimicrobiota bacterium]MBL7109643.1 alanine racemase [Candidatus Neomarinimicrobiota bacterium]
MLQPIAEINLGKLQQNYQFIQNTVDKAKVMAVVKADAYGHGAVPIAKSLENAGVFGFCVALHSEIDELISSGITKPILHTGRVQQGILDLCKTGQVRCSVNSIEDFQVVNKFGKNNNSKIKVHIKFDTGMSRLGISYKYSQDILSQIGNYKFIEVEGIWSHLASAEEKDDSFMQLQLNRFKEIKQLAKSLNLNVKFYHIANSAGILKTSESHFNMVRPGIALYGISPLGIPHSNLSPIMDFQAPVMLIKDISDGDSVGYNRTFTASEPMKIATVQAGYADGVPLEFSKSGSVIYKNNELKIIGKVSMDMTAINANNSNLKVGDKVSFWGDNTTHRIEHLSKKYGIIPYKFLNGISKRVKRIYIED